MCVDARDGKTETAPSCYIVKARAGLERCLALLCSQTGAVLLDLDADSRIMHPPFERAAARGPFLQQ